MASLNELGAILDENPTAADVRRAYRLLARRFHPDTHPHATAAEVARLSAQFMRATADYRVLSAAFTTARTHQ